MKKILKIVLGIIGVVAVIFLATGLIVKETTYEVSTTIDKPIEQVFTAFNDHTKLQEWIPNIKSFDPIDEKERKVGSTYKMIVDEKGKNFEMKETIIEYVKNEKIGLEFDAQGMFKTDAITFVSEGNKTIITNRSICKGTTYLLKCTFPYFKSMFKSTDQTYLENFKAFVEKQ